MFYELCLLQSGKVHCTIYLFRFCVDKSFFKNNTFTELVERLKQYYYCESTISKFLSGTKVLLCLSLWTKIGIGTLCVRILMVGRSIYFLKSVSPTVRIVSH